MVLVGGATVGCAAVGAALLDARGEQPAISAEASITAKARRWVRLGTKRPP